MHVCGIIDYRVMQSFAHKVGGRLETALSEHD